MPEPKAESLARHIDRIIALDTLIAAGLGDSDEADGVRDEMDVTWRAMSDFERRIARRVSAALSRSSAAEKLAEAAKCVLSSIAGGRDALGVAIVTTISLSALKSALAEYEGEGK